MPNDIYRKVSLDRLSSPEQLDALMTVTSARGWIALMSVGLLVAAVITWGFLGSVTTKVNGYGILAKSGGLQTIVSITTGQVTDIRIMPGDLVKRGDVVARVAQSEMVMRINDVQAQLSGLEQAPTQNAPAIAALKKQIISLQEQLESASQVVSAFDGRIVEVNIKQGGMLSVGMSVASLELIGEQVKELEAVLYIDAGEGKKIAPGMLVNLGPSSVNRQEYGLLLGRVTRVSKYPATNQGMLSTLGSEALVTQLAGAGAKIEARVDLVPNSVTPSGYAWSSGEGPPTKLASGTLTTGAVVIRSQRPISLLFPQLN